MFSISTYKAVTKGSELLVYYGDGYARELNINMEAPGEAPAAGPPRTASSGVSTLGDSQGNGTNHLTTFTRISLLAVLLSSQPMLRAEHGAKFFLSPRISSRTRRAELGGVGVEIFLPHTHTHLPQPNAQS